MIQPSLTFTPAAEKFIRRMVRFSDHPMGGMRLVVAPGGCSGMSAEFTIEARAEANDAELPVAGVRLFLPAASRLLLDGATIDFADTPTRSGFVITQPGAAACGCSSSTTTAPAEASVSPASIKRMPAAAGH